MVTKLPQLLKPIALATLLIVATVVSGEWRASATPSDQTQLLVLANKLVTGVSALPTKPIVMSLAAYNDWALVNWTDLKYTGGGSSPEKQMEHGAS